jgi:hypothetical protein
VAKSKQQTTREKQNEGKIMQRRELEKELELIATRGDSLTSATKAL